MPALASMVARPDVEYGLPLFWESDAEEPSGLRVWLACTGKPTQRGMSIHGDALPRLALRRPNLAAANPSDSDGAPSGKYVRVACDCSSTESRFSLYFK